MGAGDQDRSALENGSWRRLWPISTARPSNSSFNSTVPLSTPILSRCRERRPPAAPERLDAERRPPEPAPPRDNTCWKIQPATGCRPSMEPESHTHPGRIGADPEAHRSVRSSRCLTRSALRCVERLPWVIAQVGRAGQIRGKLREQQVRSRRVNSAPDRALGDAQALTLDRCEEDVDGAVLATGARPRLPPSGSRGSRSSATGRRQAGASLPA